MRNLLFSYWMSFKEQKMRTTSRQQFSEALLIKCKEYPYTKLKSNVSIKTFPCKHLSSTGRTPQRVHITHNRYMFESPSVLACQPHQLQFHTKGGDGGIKRKRISPSSSYRCSPHNRTFVLSLSTSLVHTIL